VRGEPVVGSVITVLIFDNPPGGLIDRRHSYYKNLGYGYDHEFIPHRCIQALHRKVTHGRWRIRANFLS